MKSPITAKEMKLTKEKRSLTFRKESFEIVFHFYKCEDSGEQFTSTELDELNMNQVYNQYRDLLNIPFPEEIKKIREKYQLSALKMSVILGLGANSYRQYEAGEMPSLSNARLIQLIEDPEEFIKLLELNKSLSEKERNKYVKRARILLDEKNHNIFDFNIQEYLLGEHLANIYSGYRNPDLEKFTEMVVYFSEKMKPWKTKMNKLLFYADFLMFKKSCFSMSGLRYVAIAMGPVPDKFQSIFEYLSSNGEIEIEYYTFPDGNPGEQFKIKKPRAFQADIFSDQELEVLQSVCTRFKNTSTADIIKISHEESAWKQNKNSKGEISYEHAFELKYV